MIDDYRYPLLSASQGPGSLGSDERCHQTEGSGSLKWGKDGAALAGRKKYERHRAFFFAYPDGWYRSVCIDIVCHPGFDYFILGCILVNAIIIAFDDPLATSPSDAWLHISVISDLIFLGIFTLEMFIKLIAMGGFMHDTSYFRDAWNYLDCLIVLSGLTSLFFTETGSFSILRIVRILRPLRTISRVKGMRNLVDTLTSSLPILLNVLLLCFFIFFTFGLIGVISWSTTLHQRCYGFSIEHDDYIATSVCGNTSSVSAFLRGCPEGYECLDDLPNPNQWANFDHVGSSFLVVMQCLTLDDWVTHMYNVQDGWSPFAALYFVLLTLLGAYFILNLVLAVVTDSFTRFAIEDVDEKLTEARESMAKKLAAERERASTIGGESSKVPSTPAASKASNTRTLFDTDQDMDIVDDGYESDNSREGGPISEHKNVGARSRTRQNSLYLKKSNMPGAAHGAQRLLSNRGMREWKKFTGTIDKVSLSSLKNMAKLEGAREWQSVKQRYEGSPPADPLSPSSTRKRASTLTLHHEKVDAPTLLPKGFNPGRRSSGIVGGDLRSFQNSQMLRSLDADSRKNLLQFTESAYSNTSPESHQIVPVEMTPSPAENQPLAPSGRRARASSVASSVGTWKQQFNAGTYELFRSFGRELIRHPYFVNSITALIVLNAIIMSIEHYEMDADLVDFLDKANVFFVSIFCFETAIKFIVLGPKEWASDNFNIFDLIIVLLSLSELLFLSSSAAIIFRVFRLARVIRVVKLGRRWKVLKKIINSIGSSLHYMGYLLLLLMLFVFVFGILGRAIFAGKVKRCCTASEASRGLYNCYPNTDENYIYDSCWNNPWKRPHFDTLYWSMITVFQIVTEDYWSAVMYKSMDSVGGYAALYFLSVLIFGRYLLLNLFVAILLVGLEAEHNKKEEATSAGGDACSNLDGVLDSDEESNDLPEYPPAMRYEAQQAEKNFQKATKTAMRSTDAITPVFPPRSGSFTSVASPHSPAGGWGRSSIVSNKPFIPPLKLASLPVASRQPTPPLVRAASAQSLTKKVKPKLESVIPKLSSSPDLVEAETPASTKHGADCEFQSLAVTGKSTSFRLPGSDEETPFESRPPQSIIKKNSFTINSPVVNTPRLTPQQRSTSFAIRRNPDTDEPYIEPPLTARSAARRKQHSRARSQSLFNRLALEAEEEAERKERREIAKTPLSARGKSFISNLKEELASVKTPLSARGSINYDDDNGSTKGAKKWFGKGPLSARGVRPNPLQFPSTATETAKEQQQQQSEVESVSSSPPLLQRGPDNKAEKYCHIIGTTETKKSTVAAIMERSRNKQSKSLKTVTIRGKQVALRRDGILDWQAVEVLPNGDLQEILLGYSWGCVSPENPVRLFLWKVVDGTYFPFEKVIGVLIFLSCLSLTINEEAVSHNKDATFILEALDMTFTIIFVCEVLIRITVYTFNSSEADRSSYVKRARWNWLDLVIVSISAITLTVQHIVRDRNTISGLANISYKIARAFRAWRPLRILVRSKNMRIVIGALVGIIPKVFNVFAVASVSYFMFGVVSVQLFKGSFMACNDGTNRTFTECDQDTYFVAPPIEPFSSWVPQYQPHQLGLSPFSTDDSGVIEYSITESLPVRLYRRRWSNIYAFSFNDIGNSLLTLLQCAILNGWTEVLYAVTDCTNTENGRTVRSNQEEMGLLVVFWVFFGGLGIMNLFVGSVVDYFTETKNNLDRSGLLTKDQQQTLRIKKILSLQKAKHKLVPKTEDTTLITKLCYSIVSHKYFHTVITLSISVNVIIMTTIHYQQSDAWSEFQRISNYYFTIFFTLEMLVKVNVAGLFIYLKTRWNQLDFAIVLMSWGEVAITEWVTKGNAGSIMQLFRLGRIFRLVRQFRGLKKLLLTLYYSFPAIVNVGSLLALVFFIYGIMAMSFFEGIRRVPYNDSYLNDHYNFDTFPIAILTLYRVATFDNWRQVLRACLIQAPQCTPEAIVENGVTIKPSDCGATDGIQALLIALFFSVFVLTVGFVMFNLFIAVVLENFRESVLLPKEIQYKMALVKLFRDKWSLYDPSAIQIIKAYNFVPLMRQLPSPLGFADCDFRDILPSLLHLDFLVTNDSELLFIDVIDAIGETVFKIRLTDTDKVRTHMHQLSVRKDLKRDTERYSNQFTIADWYAACLIQCAWRRWHGPVWSKVRRPELLTGDVMEDVYKKSYRKYTPKGMETKYEKKQPAVGKKGKWKLTRKFSGKASPVEESEESEEIPESSPVPERKNTLQKIVFGLLAAQREQAKRLDSESTSTVTSSRSSTSGKQDGDPLLATRTSTHDESLPILPSPTIVAVDAPSSFPPSDCSSPGPRGQIINPLQLSIGSYQSTPSCLPPVLKPKIAMPALSLGGNSNNGSNTSSTRLAVPVPASIPTLNLGAMSPSDKMGGGTQKSPTKPSFVPSLNFATLPGKPAIPPPATPPNACDSGYTSETTEFGKKYSSIIESETRDPTAQVSHTSSSSSASQPAEPPPNTGRVNFNLTETNVAEAANTTVTESESMYVSPLSKNDIPALKFDNESLVCSISEGPKSTRRSFLSTSRSGILTSARLRASNSLHEQNDDEIVLSPLTKTDGGGFDDSMFLLSDGDGLRTNRTYISEPAKSIRRSLSISSHLRPDSYLALNSSRIRSNILADVNEMVTPTDDDDPLQPAPTLSSPQGHKQPEPVSETTDQVAWPDPPSNKDNFGSPLLGHGSPVRLKNRRIAGTGNGFQSGGSPVVSNHSPVMNGGGGDDVMQPWPALVQPSTQREKAAIPFGMGLSGSFSPALRVGVPSSPQHGGLGSPLTPFHTTNAGSPTSREQVIQLQNQNPLFASMSPRKLSQPKIPTSFGRGVGQNHPPLL
eukprot:TRINITY_DN2879_c0_g1_i1.p1 TRINITY_DN2879_c0_g1~~TRINITY_DN2879_c0_g1_i1.p1  ORF type:complete len:2846 (+),score=449.60 TRINITY_DN2879_c0_g1_i1:87-8624(+)